jgi:hypothetical protein
MRNFCKPSSTSSRRWLNTVERKLTTPVAAGRKLGHFERGIDRIVSVDRLQEPARLFEKADQRFLDQKGEQPGARRGVDQRLETVGEQIGHAAGAAVFHVVMHRMGIAARGLESGKHRRRHGAARNDKALTEHKILEPALFRHHAMGSWIELGHGLVPAGYRVHPYRSSFLAAMDSVVFVISGCAKRVPRISSFPDVQLHLWGLVLRTIPE